MRDRQTCIECGKLSPETDTNYTLISSQFGWRLTRRRTPDNQFVIEWRCPDCWKNFKVKKDGPGSEATPGGPPSASSGSFGATPTSGPPRRPSTPPKPR